MALPAHTQSFSDDFNRSNGAIGSNYTVLSGSGGIVSNHVEATVNNYFVKYNTALSSTDQYVSYKYTYSATNKQAYCQLRRNSAGTNWYDIGYRPNNGDVLIGRVISGGYNVISSIPVTHNSGSTYFACVETVSGNPVITVYQDGTQIAQYTDTHANKILIGDYVAFGPGYIETCEIDDLDIGILGSAGTATNDERSAELTGYTTTNSTRDAEVRGNDTSNSERSAEVTGVLSAYSTRNVEIVGYGTNYSTRDAEITGSSTSNDSRNAEITGTGGATSSRDAQLTGYATTNSARDAELTGSNTSNSERGAEITGYGTGANDERNAEITGEILSDKNNQKLLNAGSITLPLGWRGISYWNTSSRPFDVQPGTYGLNVTTNNIEIYNGSAWRILIQTSEIV